MQFKQIVIQKVLPLIRFKRKAYVQSFQDLAKLYHLFILQSGIKLERNSQINQIAKILDTKYKPNQLAMKIVPILSNYSFIRQYQQQFGIQFTKTISKEFVLSKYFRGQVINKQKVQPSIQIILDGILILTEPVQQISTKKSIKKRRKQSLVYNEYEQFLGLYERCNINYQQLCVVSSGQFINTIRQVQRDKIFLCLVQSSSLKIGRNMLNRVINKFRYQRFRRQCQYYRKFSLFEQLHQKQIRIIIQNAIQKQFSKDEYIFLEGQSSDNIYIINQGVISILKKIALLKSNPNILYQSRTNLDQNNQVLPFIDLENYPQYQHKMQTIKMLNFTAGKEFGEQQLLRQIPRQTSAKVISLKAVLKVISKSCILEILQQRKISLKQFSNSYYQKKTSKTKLLWRQKRFSEQLNLKNHSQLKLLNNENNKKKSNLRGHQTINCQTFISSQPKYKNINLDQVLNVKNKTNITLDQNQKCLLQYVHQHKRTPIVKNRKFRRNSIKISVQKPLFEQSYFQQIYKLKFDEAKNKRMNISKKVSVSKVKSRSKSFQTDLQLYAQRSRYKRY